MRNNRLRELLNEDKPTLGTRVISPWPRIVEVIGSTGVFDYVEYTAEHSNWSLEQLENFGRATELFPSMSSMIKVEEQARGFLAQRALAAGIQNLWFADCRSAEDARECIRLVRPETPEAGGIHGFVRGRIALMGTGGGIQEAWVKAMNDAVILILIEKKGAVENLEEILSTKGVDMVQFGPSDYSISIGKPDQERSPEVQKVHRHVIETALKRGVPYRMDMGQNSFEAAKPFIEMGVRHFVICRDLDLHFPYQTGDIGRH